MARQQIVKATIVEDIDDHQDRPGAIQYACNGKGLFYMCPCGCGREGYLPFKGKQEKGYDGPSWEFNGDKESPTLRPSVHHQLKHADEVITHWHGWLRNGIWES